MSTHMSPQASQSEAAYPLDQFQHGLGQFHTSQISLIEEITQFEAALNSIGAFDVHTSLATSAAKQMLNDEGIRLTIAGDNPAANSVVANAILHHGQGEISLPLASGLFASCPLEIRYGEKGESYMDLLAFQTSSDSESIASLMQAPEKWTRIRGVLDPQGNPSGIAFTEDISLTTAWHWGLVSTERLAESPDADAEKVEVPKWRYAILYLDNERLANGLTLVVFPGSGVREGNNRSALSALPQSDAVILTAAGDEKHEVMSKLGPGLLLSLRGEKMLAIVDAGTLVSSVRPVTSDAAAESKRLGTDSPSASGRGGEFPNAIKAYPAWPNMDGALTLDPASTDLGTHLSKRILDFRMRALVQSVSKTLLPIVMSHSSKLRNSILETDKTIRDIQDLLVERQRLRTLHWNQLGKRREVLVELSTQFQLHKSAVSRYRNEILEALSESSTESAIAELLVAIKGSHTTLGLTRGMRQLVAEMKDRLVKLKAEFADANQAGKQLVRELGQQFEMNPKQVKQLSLSDAANQYQQVIVETEAFCSDPAKLLLEKSFMIDQFWSKIVERIHVVNADVRQKVEAWALSLLLPIESSLRKKKQALQSQVDLLSSLSESASESAAAVQVAQGKKQYLNTCYMSVMHLEKRLQQDAGLPMAASARSAGS